MDGQDVNGREKWRGKFDYLLVMLGSSVGFGNFWRFPYVCARNGGGAFLIPFVIFLFLGGFPLYFLELSMGQFSGKSYIHFYDVCPIFKGVSWCQLILAGLANIYYVVIIEWLLYYIGSSFLSPLPWSNCDNEWNSPNCITNRGVLKGNSLSLNASIASNNDSVTYMLNTTATHMLNTTTTLIGYGNGTAYVTAQEEFWQRKVLQMSSGFEEIGRVNVPLVLCLLGAWVLVCLCIIKGVRSSGKVVYVTVTLPYILTFILLIRVLMLDGSVDGIVKFIKPDFSKLLTFQIWIEAALQVIFSLGPCWGSAITLSSLNKFKNNCFRDTVTICLLGEGTSILAGLTIFGGLGFISKSFDLPIDSVAKAGPALAFIVYPEVLLQLPGQNVWAVMFFVMLLTVGLDSQFACCESFITCLSDVFPTLRKRKMIFVPLFCIAHFLLGIIFCTEGGIYLYQIVDWYIGAFSLLLIGFIHCVIFGWIYGVDQVSRDLYMMSGRHLPLFLRISIRYITPVILLILFVSAIISYQAPTYGGYTYPVSGIVLGLIIAAIPAMPILLGPFVVVYFAQGNTLLKKIKMALKPSIRWLPADKEYHHIYRGEENGDVLCHHLYKEERNGDMLCQSICKEEKNGALLCET